MLLDDAAYNAHRVVSLLFSTCVYYFSGADVGRAAVLKRVPGI